MANNITMPRFGRASGIETWTDADNFDVDLLAECLLEDGNTFQNGVSFDFSLDPSALNLPSSALVSRDNSVDGTVPTASDGAQVQACNYHPTPLGTMLSSQVPGGTTTMQGMPQMAPAPAMNQNQILMQQQQLQNLVNVQGMVGMMNSGAMQQNRMQHPGQALIFHDHSIGVPDPKRMRMETPLVSAVPQLAQMIPNGTQAVSNPALMMMSVQELAVAAMQQQQGRGRKKSQAQIDRRRERNRILARRTRLRKKFFFESLQKEVMDLQRENMRLKGIVKEEITTEEGQRLLDECDAAEKMPPAVLEACGEGENGLDMQDVNLVHSIQKAQHSFIITDPSLADNPIVFASDGFLQLTGYSREQVLGRNCRFLQGTDTNVETVKEIKQAMAEGDDVSVTMLNYMADGTPFWNRLFIAALRDAQNNIVNFIGVVVKVPGRKGDDEDDDEDEHDDDYDDQQ